MKDVLVRLIDRIFDLVGEHPFFAFMLLCTLIDAAVKIFPR